MNFGNFHQFEKRCLTLLQSVRLTFLGCIIETLLTNEENIWNLTYKKNSFDMFLTWSINSTSFTYFDQPKFNMILTAFFWNTNILLKFVLLYCHSLQIISKEMWESTVKETEFNFLRSLNGDSFFIANNSQTIFISLHAQRKWI